MNILVNNEIVNFSKEDFPMLISGADKSGASFFSICLMAKILSSGQKILFFSAFPQAKDEFKKQIEGITKGDVLIIDSGEEEIFLKSVDQIHDLSERVILIKNIDNYSKNLFNKFKDTELIIFSGDIDKCQFGDELSKNNFKTKIFFSYTNKIKIDNMIELPKYKGLIINKKYQGLISLDMR